MARSWPLILAVPALVACARTTMGDFDLKVPHRWHDRVEGTNTHYLSSRDSSWHWFVMVFDADEIPREQREQVAANIVAGILESPAELAVKPSLKPESSCSGECVEKLQYEGKVILEGENVPLKLLVIETPEQYLLAFGYQVTSGSTSKKRVDKKRKRASDQTKATLDSIRVKKHSPVFDCEKARGQR